MAFCVSIRGCRYTERTSVRGHMETISKQRHRSSDVASGNLTHHHHNGQ
ncbi:hypothetical protein METHP15_30006 [Pseudomonas sp. P15-2025]